MRLSIVFLVAFAIISISQTGLAKTHPHDRIAVAGAGAHLLKPKIAGGALAGGALAGKALIGKKLIGGALLGKALLLKPKLIVGGLIAGKLVKKALVVGAGALVARRLIRAIKLRKPCRRCRNCVRRRTIAVSRSVETRKSASHQIEKRSITDVVNRGLESVSDRVRGTGTGLETVGDTLNLGIGLLSNVSSSTVDGIRRGAANLGLVRRGRAVSGKMTLEELFRYVRQRNGQVCLQRIICELSAYNFHYGDEGVRFGTKLLAYESINHPEAVRYKNAQKVGLQYRIRGPVEGPKACVKRYSACQYDPRAVIADGNQKLN